MTLDNPISSINFQIMKTALLILAMASVGCAGTFGGPAGVRKRPSVALQVVNATTLAASTTLLVMDGRQTISAARANWQDQYEGGMPARVVMGSRPTTRIVTAYFASMIAVNAVVWKFLPPRWRSVLPGIVIAAQTATVMSNCETTSVCF